jgi:hypothetical protein
LLLTLVAPLILLQVAGYYAGFLGPKRLVPELRVQAVELAVIIGWTLLVLLVTALYDWRWQRAISYWVRKALLSLVVLSWIGTMFLFIGPYKETLIQDAIRHFARTLRVSLPVAVLIAAAALATLWRALDKVFREAEYADKPKVLQNEY